MLGVLAGVGIVFFLTLEGPSDASRSGKRATFDRPPTGGHRNVEKGINRFEFPFTLNFFHFDA